MPFDKNRAQTCGPSAFLNREEYLMNPGISVISPRKEVIQIKIRPNKENGIFSLGLNLSRAWTFSRLPFSPAIINLNFARYVDA